MMHEMLWEGGFAKKLPAYFAKSARPAFLMLAMAVMMRVQPFAHCAPFAAALFAAGAAAGENMPVMALGCILGALRLPFYESVVVPAVSCAAVLAGEMVMVGVPRLRRIDAFVRVSALAGAGVLLPALFVVHAQPLESLQALLCAGLAAVCAPLFACALLIRPGRGHYLAEEKTGAAAFLLAAAAGLYAFFPPAAQVAAGLFVLASPAAGAASGVAAGLFLMLGGAPIDCLAGLSLCAAVVSLPCFEKSSHRTAALGIAGPAAALISGGQAVIWYAMPAAGALCLLIGPQRMHAAAHFFAPDIPDVLKPCAIAKVATEHARRRIAALADAFGEMSESSLRTGGVPDEQRLITDMREKLCGGCAEYSDCWAGARNRGARFLCGLITDALFCAEGPPGRRILFSDGDIPPDVMRACRRGRMIPDRLGFLLRDFAERRRAELKRCADGQFLSVQLAQAREILYDFAQKQAGAPSFPDVMRVRAALEAAGLAKIRVETCGMDSFFLKSTEGSFSAQQKKSAAAALNRAFGGRYLPVGCAGGLRFDRMPRFSVQTGAACQSASDCDLCGDSHMVCMLDGGRLMALISDGMGSGDAAYRESRETVRLLHRFLSAGISRSLSIETVNRLMLTRSAEEMFATVDLCVIDLNTGAAEFSKLAASRSVILRNGAAFDVEGGRLPLGILENVQPSCVRLRLRPGDVVVMGSDGVMEAGGRMVERLALACAADAPGEICRKLVHEAGLDHGRSDDKSCICIRIGAAAGRVFGKEACRSN